KNPMYWYRLEVSLGRNSVVGTTVRRADVPAHLLADEHHRRRDGRKNYIATTVGAGCCLGATLAPSAGADDLQAAYEVFKREAENVRPGYRPTTGNICTAPGRQPSTIAGRGRCCTTSGRGTRRQHAATRAGAARRND